MYSLRSCYLYCRVKTIKQGRQGPTSQQRFPSKVVQGVIVPHVIHREPQGPGALGVGGRRVGLIRVLHRGQRRDRLVAGHPESVHEHLGGVDEVQTEPREVGGQRRRELLSQRRDVVQGAGEGGLLVELERGGRDGDGALGGDARVRGLGGCQGTNRRERSSQRPSRYSFKVSIMYINHVYIDGLMSSK